MDHGRSAPLDREALSELPLASVAYPALTPAQRDFVLDQGDRITIGDAWAFLHSQGVHSELRSHFGTSEQRRRLRQAVETFGQQFREWGEGARQDPRIAWLVPETGDAEALIGCLYRAVLERDDYATFAGLHGLLRLPNAPRWMGCISVGSIRFALSLSDGHRAHLERALAIGARSIGLPSEARPWSCDAPLLHALPTSWLYQFHPTGVAAPLIDRGYQAGLSNVGHLAILDPAVQQACSSATVKAVAMATRLGLGG